MNTERRERFKETTREEVKAVAWGQIAKHGAPALSLRAIAREMGLTAPALYRYFRDRDALVTALVIDAFNSFADALETGRNSRPENDHAGRLQAIGKAYRTWAVAFSQRYTLIFGTPIRGYCPSPETAPARKAGLWRPARSTERRVSCRRSPPARRIRKESPVSRRPARSLAAGSGDPFPCAGHSVGACHLVTCPWSCVP